MDQDLRQAERSGDPVRLLRERLRAGELTRAHVELAAGLGHPTAQALFPDAAVVHWDVGEGGGRSKALFAAEDLVGASLRASVAADWAEHLLPTWESEYPEDTRPQDAIAAARSWVDCPCDDHQTIANAAFSAAVLAGNVTAADAWDDGIQTSAPDVAFVAAHAAYIASGALDAPGDPPSPDRPTPPMPRPEREWQSLRLAAYVLGEVVKDH